MTYEILMEFLEWWGADYYGPLLHFLELFELYFADREWLGLKDTAPYVALQAKGKKSVNYPNDLVAFVPDRSGLRRSSRHEPRPVEMIVGLTALNEAQNLLVCHILPKLPPAFQELLLWRLDREESVPEDLWAAFRDAVLYPLCRVLEGRRVSALEKSQFNDHCWKLSADWTRISVDWIVDTKRVAYEDPDDALWQHVVCLFQDDPETVKSLLQSDGRDDFNVIYAYADLPPSSRGDAEFRAKFLELARSKTFIAALQHPLFHTGTNARRGVVAAGPVATPYERAEVVALGQEFGCHNCGHIHPQPKWADSLNYWILDHQPPRSKNFFELMQRGIDLVGPVMAMDFDNLPDELEKVLEPVQYRARDGNDTGLLTYVKGSRDELCAMLKTLSMYAESTSSKTFYRFFLHCHDCAGRQGGIMQAIVKIGAEITALCTRMTSKELRPKEIAYYLQCIAQLHDLLSEAFDPARPLIRLGESKEGPCSIAGSAATGTSEQRQNLVNLSASRGEGIGIRSALGLENPLVLRVSGAACHSCRATVPVPQELWTADHVSPSFLIELGLRQGPQILYPQCIYCRKAQSVLAAGFKRCWNASKTAEQWDANWQKTVGIEDGWLDPTYADEDEELLDDTFDFDGEEELPMTGGGVESPTLTRVACLRQDMNTCGQRAAYNALALAGHHADGVALQGALQNDDLLRSIGPMGLNVADNDVRNMLDGKAGQQIALVSSLARLPVLKADVANCADDGERALRAFMVEDQDDVTLVLNTLAPGAKVGEGAAKIGHYIAVRLVRDVHGVIHATYCDSLLNAGGCGALIQALLDALNAPAAAADPVDIEDDVNVEMEEELGEGMEEEIGEQIGEKMDEM